ncbi:MAG: BMP family ABC transporter substrate-binding protein [Clostridia bacterium]|nr:BMP family ABC transporter substrate-binding protein [Clostridia bacterium]
MKRILALALALCFALGLTGRAEELGLDLLLEEIETAAEMDKALDLNVSAIQSYGYSLAEILADTDKLKLATAGLLIPLSRVTYEQFGPTNYSTILAGSTPDGAYFQVAVYLAAVPREPVRVVRWAVGSATALYEDADCDANDYESRMRSDPTRYWGQRFSFSAGALQDELLAIRLREVEVGVPEAQLTLSDLVAYPEGGMTVSVIAPEVRGGSGQCILTYFLRSQEGAATEPVVTNALQFQLTASSPGVWQAVVNARDTVTSQTAQAESDWFPVALEPLTVQPATFELSPDKRSIFIDRPAITGGSGKFTIAYNIYDDQSQPVNYFYSDEERVAATPGYTGLFNVFIVVTDTATGEKNIQNIGWQNLLGDTELEPLAVEPAAFEVSPDKKSIFIDRPAITGGSGQLTVAYNIYDAESNPVNYFYSDEERVAATPGYAGLFNVFIVVTDLVTGEQDIQNIGWNKLKGEEEDEIVVAVVCEGPVDDVSVDRMVYNAVRSYCESNGVHFLIASVEAPAFTSVDEAVSVDANVIFLSGFAFMEDMQTYMVQFPEVRFIGLDFTLDEEPTENVWVVSFREDQAGFLAGYAAVALGYTHLGFVGGMDVQSVVNYGEGFVRGADQAAQDLGLDQVTVDYTYTGQFFQDDWIRTLAGEMYDGGTEVIFTCGGAICISVAEAAQGRPDAKVIGVDIDQQGFFDSYRSGMTLTSAVKGFDTAVITALDAIIDGDKWDEHAGRSETLGVIGAAPGSNFVRLAPSTRFGGSFTEQVYRTILQGLARGAYPLHGLDGLTVVQVVRK